MGARRSVKDRIKRSKPYAAIRDVAYRSYEKRVESSLPVGIAPRHVGVILDGNRRWAREMGMSDVNSGHQVGADKISELLTWCTETGVEVVTLWLLSTDNLTRPEGELAPLLKIIENYGAESRGRRLERQAGRGPRPAARQDGACPERCRGIHISRAWPDCERRRWVWR